MAAADWLRGDKHMRGPDGTQGPQELPRRLPRRRHPQKPLRLLGIAMRRRVARIAIFEFIEGCVAPPTAHPRRTLARRAGGTGSLCGRLMVPNDVH